jgi:hypothetical protein
VLASVYKGPRFFFRRGRGPLARAAYDAILFVGYAARWAAFSLRGALRRNSDHRAMARFCRRYLMVMAASILERREARR